jgi:glycosyltransferase involved in cell wall biosynthesis
MKRVWVVTPVYNGERYLAECIESVLAQTHENWRYLIVDNVSTDRTPEIAADYAARDERISLHRADRFRPMIENWNHAMRQLPPDADYVKVVHADDVLYPDCLEEMVAVAEEHPSVGLVSAFRLFGVRVYSDRAVPFGTNVVPGHEVCRRTLLGDYYLFGSPSTTLLRADCVRERESFYNEENLHSDAEACFDVLQTRDLGFVHQVLTYTRLHAEAATPTSDRLGTYRQGWFFIVTKYGPRFLGADYPRVLVWGKWGVLPYFWWLTKQTAKLRWLDPEFRQHHRETLRVLRRSVRSRDVLRGLFRLRGSQPAASTRSYAA